MIVYAKRAATVLYNFLKSVAPTRTFLLPSNVCYIVPLTFFKAGVPFEFIDISPDTLCLDFDKTRARIASEPIRYGGVLFVRTYGADISCEPFFAELKHIAPHILTIDDRAACMPRFDIAPAPFTDLILYSTGYAKMIDLGVGGFGFLRDGLRYDQQATPFDDNALARIDAVHKAAIQDRARLTCKDDHWLDTRQPEMPFDTYQAEILRQYAAITAHKMDLNAIYETLPLEIQLEPKFQAWRFNIVINDKPELLRSIFNARLFASSHYPSLAGIYANGVCLIAEKLAAHVINLFNDFYFDRARAHQIVELVNTHVEQYGIPDAGFPTVTSRTKTQRGGAQ